MYRYANNIVSKHKKDIKPMNPNDVSSSDEEESILIPQFQISSNHETDDEIDEDVQNGGCVKYRKSSIVG